MLLTTLYDASARSELALALLVAFLLDVLLGDPAWLYRVVPHPVAAFGKLVERAEARLNRPARGRSALIWRGVVVTLALVLAAGALGWGLAALTHHLPPGGWWISAVIEGLLAYSLLAYRGLHDHVRAVARGLRESLAAARAAAAKIVGRDPQSLDAAGCARAAVESLAENFSDGVVAPLFYFALFGLPGLVAYKAINTLDSMIGYRNARYEAFGMAAARLDDAANWLPSRLTGLLVVAAALVMPGARAKRAFATVLRDAPQHRSPNAGWPEAAFAGALGFALGGPRRYGKDMVADTWIGDGRRALNAADVESALMLYRVAGILIMLVLTSSATTFLGN
jgi:adenosylcobinamide-phosphate synthase